MATAKALCYSPCLPQRQRIAASSPQRLPSSLQQLQLSPHRLAPSSLQRLSSIPQQQLLSSPQRQLPLSPQRISSSSPHQHHHCSHRHTTPGYTHQPHEPHIILLDDDQQDQPPHQPLPRLQPPHQPLTCLHPKPPVTCMAPPTIYDN